jgi:YfiH family protein
VNVPVLQADWPAPARVHALQTLRCDGFDDGDSMRSATFAEGLQLPSPPRWLRQVHGTRIVELPSLELEPAADASFTRTPGVVCAVMTADCLPVFVCEDSGAAVAVAHAGWRGLCAGVIEQTVRALDVRGDRLIAWLGAAIGQDAFEVGPEVCEAFVAADPQARSAFRRGKPGKLHAYLYALARQRLQQAGVARIGGGGLCTYADPRFHSYRRGAAGRRMASLIWMER